jgi:hypothetical protein
MADTDMDPPRPPPSDHGEGGQPPPEPPRAPEPLTLAEQLRQSERPKTSAMAPPKPFTAKPGEVDTFFRHCKTYIFLNPTQFPTEADKIGFLIGLCQEGPAAKWADWYADKYITPNSLATYDHCLGQFLLSFRDPNKERASQNKLETLKQGRMHAYEFFVEFATLAQEAGYDTERDWKHIRLLLDRNMNPFLIDKLYAHTPMPNTYAEYVDLLYQLDSQFQMRASRNPFAPNPFGPRRQIQQPSHGVENVPMDVDKKTPTRTYTKLDDRTREDLRRRGACFYCRKEGHMASACPLKLSAAKPNAPTQPARIRVVRSTKTKEERLAELKQKMAEIEMGKEESDEEDFHDARE